MRSGTSIGANIEEAYGTISPKDFINKMCISLKEARETNYWLRIIIGSKLISENRLSDILKESDEIMKIIAKIIITSKKNLNESE
jgi:four helix bundle protein